MLPVYTSITTYLAVLETICVHYKISWFSDVRSFYRLQYVLNFLVLILMIAFMKRNRNSGECVENRLEKIFLNLERGKDKQWRRNEKVAMIELLLC